MKPLKISKNKNEFAIKSTTDSPLSNDDILMGYLNAIPFYILLIDEDHTIIQANRAVENSLGFNPSDLIGKYCPKIVHGIDSPYEGCPLEEAVEKDCIVIKELYDFKKDLWFESAVYPTKYKTPENKRIFIHMINDITEKKQAQREVSETLKHLRSSMRSAINTMALIVERRDPYTAGHQQHVSDLARSIANEMNLAKDTVDGIRMAGVIHDIGKIFIPAEILNKPGKLTKIEFSLIKTHPEASYEILKGIEFPWPIAEIVLQHHERINGTGYPNKSTEKEILIEAKIIAVADVVEAMASHRPYRPALGIKKALEEISANKGKLFDAKVVDSCIKLFKKNIFTFR